MQQVGKSKILEKDILKAILEWLQWNHVFATRINTIGVPLKDGGFRPSPMRGVCDIIGVIPRKKEDFGIPLYIEVKSKTGQPTWEQQQFLMNASSAGALAFVARSLEEVMEKLKPYL